jgi:dTDP-4-amino-4,6-dideoxygalactose transaminase
MSGEPARPLRLLVPDLPSPEAMLPWLRRMEAAGVYTNFGPLSRELEERLASRWGTEQAIAVTTAANGTSALTLALAALDLPAGSAVLVPALTFSGTAAAVVAAGLRPVLGAVDDGTWLLTPDLAERAAAVGVAAAVPVAVFGQPVPVDPWDALSERTGMRVVVDAAGAIGDQHVGRLAGVVVSLHATKPLPAGEGGAFAAADAGWVRGARELSNFGFAGGVSVRPGGNAKLSEWHAAVALAGLESWPRRAWRLRRLAADYAQALVRLGGRAVLPAGHRPWVRTTLVARIRGGVPDGLSEALDSDGVPTRRWYFPPLHAHPAYAACETFGDLDATSHLAAGLLGLPFHAGMRRADVDRVVASLSSRLR